MWLCCIWPNRRGAVCRLYTVCSAHLGMGLCGRLRRGGPIIMSAGLLARCCIDATGGCRLWITVIHRLFTLFLCGQPVNKLWITFSASLLKNHTKNYPQVIHSRAHGGSRRPPPLLFERATIITHFGWAVNRFVKTLQRICVHLATWRVRLGVL